MDRLLYMDLIAQHQADTQALRTVMYLGAAVLLWALLYFNYLLLSVYFTPITWALLCSIPLRRWQDAILKDSEKETSVRWVCLRICVGVCRQVLYDVVADSLTGNLCRALVVWVVGSRLVDSLGWSTGMLSASALLVIGLLLFVFYKVPCLRQCRCQCRCFWRLDRSILTVQGLDVYTYLCILMYVHINVHAYTHTRTYVHT